MKKEDMQIELEKLTAKNGELSEEVDRLGLENLELGEQNKNLQAKIMELTAIKDDTVQDNKRLVRELAAVTKSKEQLMTELETPGGMTAVQTVDPRQLNESLLAAVIMSCTDHCPHHRELEACRNCEIGKLLAKVGTTGCEYSAPDGAGDNHNPNTGEYDQMENIKNLTDDQIKQRQKCALMLCALVENGIRIEIFTPKFIEVKDKSIGYLNALEQEFVERHPETEQVRNQQFLQACESTIAQKAEFEFDGETPELDELFTQLESALDDWAETLPDVTKEEKHDSTE